MNKTEMLKKVLEDTPVLRLVDEIVFMAERKAEEVTDSGNPDESKYGEIDYWESVCEVMEEAAAQISDLKAP